VNPVNQKTRDQGLFFTGEPTVFGSDIAGEVIELGIGESVSHFGEGEHVFAQASNKNDFPGLQRYALVDARFAAKVAATGLSDDQAATVPVCAIAAYVALFHETGLGLPAPTTDEAQKSNLASQTILIIGGGSNCGRYAIEFAKIVGFGKIIAVAGLRNEQELKGRGASHVVDRHSNDVLGQIQTLVGDELVYAVDTVNYGPAQELGVAVLSNSKKGTLATLLPTDGPAFEAERIGPKTASYGRRMTHGASILHPDLSIPFWKSLPGWIKEGKLRPLKFDVIEGLDVDRVDQALDGYRDGQVVKVNVHPWGDSASV
jgi:NADPH2:quinone reductase